MPLPPDRQRTGEGVIGSAHSVRPRLTLDGISHTFAAGMPHEVRALGTIDLEIRPGQFVSIIGRSGCGKTTLFNVIAGLLHPTAGRVVLDGADITGRAGLVSYMLQKDLLLPWRTAVDNVILGLEVRDVPRRVARERALPLMRQYGLGGFERHYPAALSGGMRQRVALLRTLLCESDVILLDEPFGALDAQTRFQMQQWLLDLWRDFGKTVVFVTHDVDEAVYLSDVVYVLSPRPGRVEARLDVPFDRPRERKVMTSVEFSQLKERCFELLFDAATPPDARRASR